eukprot:96732-Rhodomonas_salina.1
MVQTRPELSTALYWNVRIGVCMHSVPLTSPTRDRYLFIVGYEGRRRFSSPSRPLPHSTPIINTSRTVVVVSTTMIIREDRLRWA